jgi:hypothetical protein
MLEFIDIQIADLLLQDQDLVSGAKADELKKLRVWAH